LVAGLCGSRLLRAAACPLHGPILRPASLWVVLRERGWTPALVASLCRSAARGELAGADYTYLGHSAGRRQLSLTQLSGGGARGARWRELPSFPPTRSPPPATAPLPPAPPASALRHIVCLGSLPPRGTRPQGHSPAGSQPGARLGCSLLEACAAIDKPPPLTSRPPHSP
jgi:hypothetical protein